MKEAKDEDFNIVTKEDFKRYFYERSEVKKKEFIEYKNQKRGAK